MKAKAPKTPANLTLDQVLQHFGTDEAARDYLEAVRWPTGPVCPRCGNCDPARIYRIQPNPSKQIRAGLYDCAECHRQFTVTVGTIFEDSKIPLRKWLVAWYMLCSSKNGVAALEMQRMLGLGSYRTAWHMMHRIRYALRDPVFTGEKMGGTIEADETWIGGVRHRRFGHPENKTPVMGILERGGNVRPVAIEAVNSEILGRVLSDTVKPTAHLMTDQLSSYRSVGKGYASHEHVNHGVHEYVKRGKKGEKVTTNAIEGFFGQLKRSLDGTHHSVSRKHLPLYLAEHEFRFNERASTDGERTIKGMKKAEGKRLMLKKPKSDSN